MKKKLSLGVAFMAVMVFFVGTASADLIFGASFDSSVGADVAGGEATGYRYATDHASANTLASRETTTNDAQFGAASLDCTAGTLLAYRTTNNVNWTNGTIEMFVQMPQEFVSATRDIARLGESRALGIAMAMTAAGARQIKYYWNNGYLGTASNGAFTDGEFTHVAVTWDISGGAGTGVVKLYVNGTLEVTATGKSLPSVGDPTMWFGSAVNGANGRGYIDEIAIYDTIEYTANFTPRTRSAITKPTPVFAVDFDSSVDADIAAGDGTGYRYATDHASSDTPANREITTDAAQFGAASLDCDPEGVHLAYRTTDNINWTNGTIEMFVQMPQESVAATRYCARLGGSRALGVDMATSAAGALQMKYYWNNAYLGIASDGAFTDGEFTHVAVTWDISGGASTGVIKLYVDGTLEVTATGKSIPTVGDPTMWFGGYYSTGDGGRGYIDDIAIYDTVVYHNDFTPRTSSIVPPPPPPSGTIIIIR